jgi:hypothetical protein
MVRDNKGVTHEVVFPHAIVYEDLNSHTKWKLLKEGAPPYWRTMVPALQKFLKDREKEVERMVSKW